MPSVWTVQDEARGRGLPVEWVRDEFDKWICELGRWDDPDDHWFQRGARLLRRETANHGAEHVAQRFAALGAHGARALRLITVWNQRRDPRPSWRLGR